TSPAIHRRLLKSSTSTSRICRCWRRRSASWSRRPRSTGWLAAPGRAYVCRLVVETLEPLEGTRKCFRMVGEVLMERTVQDVLPLLKTNEQGASTGPGLLTRSPDKGGDSPARRAARGQGPAAGRVPAKVQDPCDQRLGQPDRRPSINHCATRRTG